MGKYKHNNIYKYIYLYKIVYIYIKVYKSPLYNSKWEMSTIPRHFLGLLYSIVHDFSEMI